MANIRITDEQELNRQMIDGIRGVLGMAPLYVDERAWLTNEEMFRMPTHHFRDPNLPTQRQPGAQ